MTYDEAAERVCVGVCLNTRHGFAHVRDVVQPEDFRSASLGQLYAAALAMPEVVGLEERIRFAAEFTDVPETRIRRLISQSPVMFDATSWAHKVAAAARQREQCA